MYTIGRKRPRSSPRGDHTALCDYCGAKWHRSDLRRDGANLLACPDDYRGLDSVTLSRMNAEMRPPRAPTQIADGAAPPYEPIAEAPEVYRSPLNPVPEAE